MYISARRALLDAFLNRLAPELRGRAVLDVGGTRQRRGQFQISAAQAARWTIVNRESQAEPDLLTSFPPLPYPDASFDFVLCTEVLEYSMEPDVLIREMLRVAGPRGRVVLAVPFLNAVHGDSEFDYLRFTPSYFRRLAERSGVHCRIAAMGGMPCVAADLWLARLSRGGEWSRPLRAIARWVGRAIVVFDTTESKRRISSITTGYWVEFSAEAIASS